MSVKKLTTAIYSRDLNYLDAFLSSNRDDVEIGLTHIITATDEQLPTILNYVKEPIDAKQLSFAGWSTEAIKTLAKSGKVKNLCFESNINDIATYQWFKQHHHPLDLNEVLRRTSPLNELYDHILQDITSIRAETLLSILSYGKINPDQLDLLLPKISDEELEKFHCTYLYNNNMSSCQPKWVHYFENRMSEEQKRIVKSKAAATSVLDGDCYNLPDCNNKQWNDGDFTVVDYSDPLFNACIIKYDRDDLYQNYMDTDINACIRFKSLNVLKKVLASPEFDPSKANPTHILDSEILDILLEDGRIELWNNVTISSIVGLERFKRIVDSLNLHKYNPNKRLYFDYYEEKVEDFDEWFQYMISNCCEEYKIQAHKCLYNKALTKGRHDWIRKYDDYFDPEDYADLHNWWSFSARNVKFLIEEYGLDPGYQHNLLLHQAVQYRDERIVDYLLELPGVDKYDRNGEILKLAKEKGINL